MYPQFTAIKDGVKLTKRVTEADEQPSTVQYKFTSQRPDTVHIRVVEPTPGELTPNDVGVHATHGHEHWSIEEDPLQFAHDIEPESEYKTLISISPRGQLCS